MSLLFESSTLIGIEISEKVVIEESSNQLTTNIPVCGKNLDILFIINCEKVGKHISQGVETKTRRLYHKHRLVSMLDVLLQEHNMLHISVPISAKLSLST